uniref:Uncharacterized protein n=2 Tax=Zea mays TaxID=4577 RepID=A0A804UBZ9_MAIZE
MKIRREGREEVVVSLSGDMYCVLTGQETPVNIHRHHMGYDCYRILEAKAKENAPSPAFPLQADLCVQLS